MATKNNPGKFDCYGNAAPDEPLFVLLARDEFAPALIAIWAHARNGNDLAMRGALRELGFQAAKKLRDNGKPNPEKIEEALKCAAEMKTWKTLHV